MTLLATIKSGTAAGTGDSLVQACERAKHQAHQEQCELLASDKEIGACDCNADEQNRWTCHVDYQTTCRSYAAFTPVYVQTGTAKGTSLYARTLACAAAKVNAKPFKCRVDRFEKLRDDCLCET